MSRLIAAVSACGAVLLGVASASQASTASNLFAVVGQAGNVVAGGGVSGVAHVGTGQYEVTFTQNVSGCAYAASTENAASQALMVSANGGHASVNGVFVETKNQGGGLTDGPFDLTVDCGQAGMSYAVVGYSANLVRATAGASLTNLGIGRYRVSFPTKVSGCAYLATLGDPGNGVAFTPSLVATSSGSNGKSVYVETKNIAGGLASGIPFHLSVICPSAAGASVLVVGANGIAARGSALTSAFTTGTGTYTVVTNRTVSHVCAAVATRGQTDKAVPFDPATVETLPGLAPNTFNVQTRLPVGLSGGGSGTFVNEAFDAAVIC